VNTLAGADDSAVRRKARAAKADDAAQEIEITRLVAAVTPVIDGILAHACRGDRALRESIDDVRADVVTRMLHKLRETRDGGQAVEHLNDYVATLTRNCVTDFLRARNPERTRLSYRLRFVMTNDPRFAMWSAEGTTRCGLAEWRASARTAAAVMPAGSAPRDAFDGTRTADALAAIFRAVGGPLEFDRLVTWLMDLWNIAEETAVDIESVLVADARPTQLASLETRTFLESLWSEVGALPQQQRAALLLNLRDHERGNALTLFVLLGIADVDAIAAAIGVPAEELAELWSDLPLDDATIAERLGVSRQQVINLRKSARERLRRRMGT
jgi:hypothetical protein